MEVMSEQVFPLLLDILDLMDNADTGYNG